MRDLFKNLAKYALLRGIAFIALGLLMLFAPQSVMNVIVYIIAGYLIVLGAVNVIGYFKNKVSGDFGFDLISGIMKIVLGIVLIVFTEGFISILPIFMGVLLIIGGLSRLIEGVGGGVTGFPRVLLIVLGVAILIGGFLVVTNPFSSAVFLFQIFGAFVVVQGISELASYFTFKQMSNS